MLMLLLLSGGFFRLPATVVIMASFKRVNTYVLWFMVTPSATIPANTISKPIITKGASRCVGGKR